MTGWFWGGLPIQVHGLMVASALLRMAAIGLLPFIPVLLPGQPWTANLVISAFLSGDLLGGLFLGYWADRSARQLVCMISGGVILLTGTLFLLFGITRPWLLASLAFWVGFGVLGMGILVLAWMTRITPEPSRKALYQYQFWAANVISVSGFGLGWAILRWMDVRCLCVVTLLVIAFAHSILLLCELKGGFVPPTDPGHGIGLARTLQALSPWLWALALVRFLLALAHQQLRTTLPYYLGVYHSDPGPVYVISIFLNLLVSIGLQRPIEHAAERSERLRTAFLCCLPMGMALLSLPRTWALYLAVSLYSLGEVVAFPLCQHLAERTVPEQAKGTCFGLLNLTRIGFVLGGPAGALISIQASYAWVFLLFGLCLGLAVLLVRLHLKAVAYAG